jgi:hypothetical protein
MIENRPVALATPVPDRSMIDALADLLLTTDRSTRPEQFRMSGEGPRRRPPGARRR